MFELELSGVFELRALTRYRSQYDVWHRNDPPLVTRATPSSGPCGLWESMCSIEEPVRATLPGVSRHGIKPKVIPGKGVDRAGSGIAIVGGIEPRELALPDIAAMFAVMPQLVAPRMDLLQTKRDTVGY